MVIMVTTNYWLLPSSVASIILSHMYICIYMYVCIYDFQQFETIASFGDNIYTGKISIDEAEMGQINILKNRVEFNKSKPKKEHRE